MRIKIKTSGSTYILTLCIYVLCILKLCYIHMSIYLSICLYIYIYMYIYIYIYINILIIKVNLEINIVHEKAFRSALSTQIEKPSPLRNYLPGITFSCY